MSPTVAAIGTSAVNVRARWGTSTNINTSTIGSEYTAPRLWVSSTTPQSRTTLPARTPRSHHATSRRPANTIAGHTGMKNVAAAALG